MESSPDQGTQWWKDEPVSPKGVPSLWLDDEDLLFFNDDTLQHFSNNAAESMTYIDPVNRAQVASDAIDEIEKEIFIKEESLEAWMEQSTNLSMFEDYSLNIAPSEDGNPSNDISYQSDVLKPQQQQQNNTQTFLQEFETVLGNVGVCHQIIPPISSALTPPQSPPPSKTPPPSSLQQSVDTQLLITLQPVQQLPLFSGNEAAAVYNTVVPVVDQLYASNAPRQWNTIEDIPLDKDVANDLAVVDEYVRSHTKDIPSPSSPGISSGSSSVSAEDVVDDPDWCLDSERRSKPSTSRNPLKAYHQRSRSSIEDKKVRKKEQNKNAATRYRQKKKQEVKEIQCEEHELQETNEKLKSEIVELERKIKYTKGLMRDVFKAKGFLR